MFDSPAQNTSSDVRVADLEGHLLVIEPQEYVASITTTMGEKDAVRVRVHDISQQTTHEDVLFFPKVLVGSLKNKIGSKVLALLSKGTAKAGQSAPWILIDATTQGDAVKAATEYMLKATAASFDTTSDTAEPVAVMAAESGNPLLAAALGKLGAQPV